ncbi:glutathione S-transferase family protein [Dyella dinghuensis]|uniref:Glutathione S-transferase family protein n=1 Tax=Dyella dinghuensis TaxID=1920169 RepID=A0A432LST7_9GAMM|nr:glutathione S-transferase family protein [Dyella dinghuensis]RUL63350.1 glutathione S-transferase family protein [Dyella dinghuensis]
MTSKIDFYHAPNSRSGGTLALLEELGVDYNLHLINLKSGEQRQSAYRHINPMGKVPAIRHLDTLITEQPAVFLYLADLFAEKGLAPALGDPLRGPYVRWLVYYGSSFEPAVVDRSSKREPVAPSTSPYGTWDDVYNTVTGQLEKGPYLLGERFTAADVLWGGALHWMALFKIMPETPAVRTYIDRVVTRPAIQRAAAKDVEYAAQQAAA